MTWKVLEKQFGPRKCWKSKLKVLESPGKNILESHAFFYWFKWPYVNKFIGIVNRKNPGLSRRCSNPVYSSRTTNVRNE